MTGQTDGVSVPMKGQDLEPEIQRFVREMGQDWAKYPGFATAPAAEQRRIAELVRAPWTRGGPDMSSVTELRIPVQGSDVRVRRYDPSPTGPKPALIYLHGGGWTIFSLDTHDRVMREYAARAGVCVLGVDYALSPEAKFPVALDQTCAVVRYVCQHGPELGIEPARVTLGGDSAGGNLSVAACLRLRDEGDGHLVRGMLLNYGGFGPEVSAEARHRFGGEGYMLSSDEVDMFWGNYLRDERDMTNPLVCPLRANLRGLPPALMVVAECDVITEQNLLMADKLREAGVRLQLEVYRGASHSFLEAVSIAPVADRAFADSARWLRQYAS
jgi:acetyl esterase